MEIFGEREHHLQAAWQIAFHRSYASIFFQFGPTPSSSTVKLIKLHSKNSNAFSPCHKKSNAGTVSYGPIKVMNNSKIQMQ